MSISSSLFKDSSSLWTFILCSAFSVRTLVQGEVLVIGSNLPIIAAPGDDVTLPCHVKPMFDVQGLTVEWSQPDLKPDPSDRLSRVEYVHLYRDRKEVPDMKLASYFRRTELFTDGLKHGNISLKIRFKRVKTVFEHKLSNGSVSAVLKNTSNRWVQL